MKSSTLSALAAIVLPLVSAQLSGKVGPLTSRASKAAKICNVLDHGGKASKASDIGPALTSAFAACKNGGTVYVPPGDYGMTTFVTLSGGSAWALKLDGIIYRVNGGNGNMIMIKHTTDFELYSSTSKGAIQGYGYEYHRSSTYGPRLLRLFDVTNWSVHDIALVDSPSFHFSIDTCTNGEVYNMIIRGGNQGGLDGIDVWGKNMWIHDIEVTNKDECVTVKNPSKNFLIEDIYCNSSGGCGMGSYGNDNVAISDIIYNNVYTYKSNQMFMFKSNGGSGYVSNCQFNNFIGRSNAHSLNINAAWPQAEKAPGDGVIYENLSFNNWKGTAANAKARGPINLGCQSTAPCTNITITDFAIGSETGSTEVNVCQNAYGSGGCLKPDTGSRSAYSATQNLASLPAGYKAATMPRDLVTPFALDAMIPIPAIPDSFFPGRKPVYALMANGGGAPL
ncbi:hypothetical protein DSL72_007231 [Monilinia vaccinii-corymbosi]|uniref:Pectate lyase superfamily protein domain-containing protein n=1 Tax=Monilinia vaccinii-corymbosi TaxID=61207 RepID=A0A8A3PMN2_9HELO|nr:hypothetical protein DSL72_007231 [Monilinia vaccinii-corymbosi]